MARVLVVDDDPGTLATCEAVLRHAGYEVETTASRAGALEALHRWPFDLLLADVRLPDGTGLDLVRQLRDLGSEMPVVVMTGYRTIDTGQGAVDTAAEATRLGAAGYLEKPVFDEDLLRAVKRTLSRRPSDARVRANGLARWADAVSLVIDAPHDPRTVSDWARLLGVASDTLRGWCRTIEVSPKRSLDLARLLRTVRHAARRRVPVVQFLRVAEQRTLRRLLRAGGLTEKGPVPTLAELLSRQALVTEPAMAEELRATLREHGVELDG